MTFRSALAPGLLSAALLALPALAQDSAATAPAAAGAAPAGPTVEATYRDWQIVCAPQVEGQPRQCEMYQLLRDPSNQPIAEISIAALPLGAEFAAGATVTTPLETFLPTGLGFYIGALPEDGQMRVEGFRVCTVVGCVVRMGLSVDEVDRMKSGSTATAMIAPFVAIDQPVQITISLAGFTAAYEDLQNRLAEAAAAARANQ
ncbi:MAG: invasion associated locus B family protein [Rhodobacteraceae bacterium]|nr:invasion associated locus B family protein [Paracoccaceae bacterium]